MATAGSEPVSDGTDNADIQSVSKNIQLVSEDVLLNLCKGPLRNFARNCQDAQYVKKLTYFFPFSKKITQVFTSSNRQYHHANRV